MLLVLLGLLLHPTRLALNVAVMLPPLLIVLASALLGHSGVVSSRGLLILALASGGVWATSRMVCWECTSPVLWIPLVALFVPLFIGHDGEGPAEAGIGVGPTGERPNLILVTIDTLRPDHLGLAGYERPTSPWLDSLASNGVVFTNAYAPMPCTAPAHATIMTGMYAFGHGVRRNGWPLPGDVTTLAELLRSAGYSTGAAVGVAHLSSAFGWGRGFDWFHDQGHFDRFFPHSGLILIRMLTRFMPWTFACEASEPVARAIGWIESEADEPFFIWLHLWDPHDPYLPPEQYLDRFDADSIPPEESGFPSDEMRMWRDGYDGEILYTDHELGKLWRALRRIGVHEKTVIAVVSDHGESLGERSFRGHSILLYEEQIRVLFLLSAPSLGFAAGRTISVPVGLVDIAPTLLDLLGMKERLRNPDGISLVDAVRGDESTDRVLFAESDMWGFRGRAVIEGKRKLIRYDSINLDHPGFAEHPGTLGFISGTELYDIVADPSETRNLASSMPELAARLSAIMCGLGSEDEPESNSFELPPMLQNELRSLGYLE